MNWNRAKTILILLLLGVNVILGGVWFNRVEQVRSQEAYALEALCDLLLQNGLTATPKQIPGTTAFAYAAKRSAAAERTVAEALLGEFPEATRSSFQNDRGAVEFRSQAHVAMELQSVGLSDLLDALGVTEAPDGNVYTQTVRGLPVWDCQMTVSPLGDSGLSVSGRRILGDILPVKASECFSAGYCLLSLTANWERTGILESCELGLITSPLSSDVTQLIPRWRFVISGEVFYWPDV